jgi:hypothetical protein
VTQSKVDAPVVVIAMNTVVFMQLPDQLLRP